MRQWLAALLVVAFALAAHDLIAPAREVHAQSQGGGFIPIASGWNISSVSSGSAIFATNLTTKTCASAVRLDVTLGSTATLAVYETDGTHTLTSLLNGGTALTGGCRYTFVFEARNANQIGGVTQSGAGGATVTTGFVSGVTPYQFNFVVGAPTTVPEIRATECTSGVD